MQKNINELKLEHFSILLPTQIGMIGVVGNIVNHFSVLSAKPWNIFSIVGNHVEKIHNTG